MARVFLSFKFDGLSSDLARSLGEMLRSRGIEVATGREASPTGALNERLRDLITKSDLLVSLRVKGSESPYLDAEAGVATGAGKELVFVSYGEENRSGMFSHHAWVNLLPNVFDGMLQLGTYLDEFVNRMGLQPPPMPAPARHSPKQEVDLEGWAPDVRAQIWNAKLAIDASDFKRAEEIADRLMREHSDCWRGFIIKSYLFIRAERFSDAEAILLQVGERFASHGRACARALHNRAWSRELQARTCDSAARGPLLAESAALFNAALKKEPRPIAYLSTVTALLRIDRIDEAQDVFVDFMSTFDDYKVQVKDYLSQNGQDFARNVVKSSRISQVVFGKGTPPAEAAHG